MARILFAMAMTVLATSVADASCRAEVGAAKAKTYVSHCLQVSPATRPPCNAANDCALIISEVNRGCRLIGRGAPRLCSRYRN